MSFELCRHIFTRGTRCQSPAMRDTRWCFFHTTVKKRHETFRHNEATRAYLIPGQHIELAPVEDRESVQLALSMVINALATGQLEVKRATALLYGLQLASMNVHRLTHPHAADIVQTSEDSPDGHTLAESATAELNLFDPELEEEAENEPEEEDREDLEDEEIYAG